MAQQTAADDRSTELRTKDAVAVDGSAEGRIGDDTLYLDQDEAVQGTPREYAPVEVRTEGGEVYRGTCTTFGRVMGPTGGFYQHEVALHVAGLGTVWVHTGRDGEDEVELAAEDAEAGWNEALGEVAAVDFTVAYEGEDEAEGESEGEAEGEAGTEGEAETVAVAYETAHGGDLKVETGTVLEASPYQHRTPQDDEVYVEVQREAGTVYLRVPTEGRNVYGLHHATRRHDSRQGSLVGLVAEASATHCVCMDCAAWLDHTVPVNTGHATTGDSGCPHCGEAEGVRYVVHEVGQGRTVLGGHVPAGSRAHGGSVSLEAARAITQD